MLLFLFFVIQVTKAPMVALTLADISNVQLRKVAQKSSPSSRKQQQKQQPLTPINVRLRKVDGMQR